jgi:spermidine synthase
LRLARISGRGPERALLGTALATIAAVSFCAAPLPAPSARPGSPPASAPMPSGAAPPAAPRAADNASRAASSSAAAAADGVLFDKRSPFTRVVVVERAGRRCLKFGGPGGVEQSCMDVASPERPVHEYVRYVAGGLPFVADPPRVLMIGLGGGSIVRTLRAHVPGIRFDVVEIDPRVIEAARLHFGVADSAEVRVVQGDGRAYVQSAAGRWDAVVLDAFGEEYVPFELSTVEFVRGVRARIEPGGAVIANLWDTNDKLFRAMLKTIAQVFSPVYVFEGVASGNVIVVGKLDSARADCRAAQQRAAAYAARHAFSFDLMEGPKTCKTSGEFATADVPVLRDSGRRDYEQLGPP